MNKYVGLSGTFLCASHIAATLGKSVSQSFDGWQVFHFEHHKTSNYIRSLRQCPHYTGWLIMPTRKILGLAVHRNDLGNVRPSN